MSTGYCSRISRACSVVPEVCARSPDAAATSLHRLRRVFAGWGQGMPSQEKFSFGGPGSVRGLVESKADSLAFANLELRSKWIEGFSTALFTDWGFSSGSKLKGTVGIEARVAVPLVGMTRLILAWPVNDPGYQTLAPRFQFSFGS